MSGRTEELLVGTTLLNDLNKTRLQLLNGRNVVGEDTHFSGLGGDVDLDTVGGGRQYAFKPSSELPIVNEGGVGRHVHVGRLEDSLLQSSHISFQPIKTKRVRSVISDLTW